VDSNFGVAPVAIKPGGLHKEVNSKLSRDYLEESDIGTWLTFAAGTNSNIDPVLAMRLAAFARDNDTVITITSAYRSTERQAQIYKDRGGYQDETGKWTGVSERIVATPGSSWHEYGQAIDTSANSILANASEAELNKYGLTKVPDGGSAHDGHIQSIESMSYSQDKKPYFDAYNR
jgi:hypothetical protein